VFESASSPVECHSKALVPVNGEVLHVYAVDLAFDLLVEVEMNAHDVTFFNKICSLI
jgi:hypothetical protein